MQDRNAREAIIFIHLPKCGGTTFNRIIEWEYPPLRVFSIDPSFFRWSYHRLQQWPARRLARIQVFKGHMPFGLHELLPQPATYITVLRDPIDRAVSEYYYALTRVVHPQHKMMKRLTLEEYILQTRHANIQTKLIAGIDRSYDFLAGECNSETLTRAKDNLASHFRLVGLTDRFEECLALAKVFFGWRVRRYASFNVTRAHPDRNVISPDVRGLIAQRYEYDVELYAYATRLFNEMIASNRAAVEKELREVRSAKALSSAGSFSYRAASAARKAICRVSSAI
jgi:Galactose-3-O-sulfotransferase